MDSREIILESADMHDNGAIVTFADGKFAFYSASLLRSMFPHAKELQGTEEDAEYDVSWKRTR
jgi:prepilin-type processing-associated H-X9-DG protein